ncbi:MAG: hypothetical protein ACOC3D_07125 [Pseudomonadota bacterium]
MSTETAARPAAPSAVAPWIYVGAFMLVFATFIVLSVLVRPIPWNYPDNAYYLAMASGTWLVGTPPETVPEPFANRVLMPLVVGAIARTTGVDVWVVMTAVNLATLVVLGLVVAAYLQRRAVPLPLALAVAAMPIFGTLARFLNTVDAAFVLIAMLLLVAVFEGRRWSVGPLALGAALIRTTVVAYLPFLLLRAVAARAWLVILLLVAAAVLAPPIIAAVKPYDTANIHGLSGLVYLLLKIPVNLVKNVLGFDFWTNTKAWCEAPFWRMDVGFLPMLGNVREVGICAPELDRVVNTLMHYLCVLGVLPALVVWWGLRSAVPRTLRPAPADLDRIVMFWAFVAFFVTAAGYGSSRGAALGRLFIYALPWLIVLLPRLPALPIGFAPLVATVAANVFYHAVLLARGVGPSAEAAAF